MRTIILSCAVVLFGIGSVHAQESDDVLGNLPPIVEEQNVQETAVETTVAQAAPVKAASQSARNVQSQSAPAPQDAAQDKAPFGNNINKIFIDAIGPSGIKNIVDAEQVFCYEVTNRPANYQGYTLNNMAVVGFCGVLNKDLATMINDQLFETPSNFLFDTAENCMVNARILLRYVRGVDSTDVVLSAPCHSMIVYYGGNVKAFNMRPGAELIDSVSEAFSNNRVDFASPALLNQMLPIGIPQSIEQQNLVESKRGNMPVRNWDQTGGQASTSGNEPKRGGWNNLNI